MSRLVAPRRSGFFGRHIALGPPSPRCASAIQIIRPLESTVETQPQLQPALLRLSVMISQYVRAHFSCGGSALFGLLFFQSCIDVINLFDERLPSCRSVSCVVGVSFGICLHTAKEKKHIAALGLSFVRLPNRPTHPDDTDDDTGYFKNVTHSGLADCQTARIVASQKNLSW
jgi:hypothetical protein